ncbi:MAG TPA: NAD(P)-dependent oxidoreductase, partial [Anaeromyxobacteraceae bacterium]|nr:NAD(P)-dependent oxidoreductase [Anaeromyxobacteraceae bacterium]
MKVLVTGAGGYLGRHVVSALIRRGHSVRALDLATSRMSGAKSLSADVEEVRADLCSAADLARACQGVDGVVHLAAKMSGDADSIVRVATEGTRGLLAAMVECGVGRLILASSLSVYAWSAIDQLLDEESPLEPHPELRDAYTISKLRQEELVRSWQRTGRDLTVLRPAVLWGRGREYPPTIGQKIGPFHVLIGAGRQVPLVHVENCADAFAAVVDGRREGTFNVIDWPEVTVSQFVRDHLRRSGRFGLRIPVAYGPSLAGASLLHRLAPNHLKRRLPSFVARERFAARYKPVRIDG